MQDVITQTQIQGPIISANNHDAIMTAYALLPKELTKGIPDYSKEKKKKKKNTEVGKDEPSAEGESLPLDSTERGDGSDSNTKDECLSPIAELLTRSVDMSKPQSRMRNNKSDFTAENLSIPQSPNPKAPKKILQVGPRGADNFTAGAITLQQALMPKE